MIHDMRKLRMYMLWIIDLIITLASFFCAVYIRFGDLEIWQNDQRFAIFLVVFTSTFISLLLDLNVNFMRRRWYRELLSVLEHNVLLLVITIIIGYMLHNSDLLSRLVIGYFFIICTPSMFVERMLIKTIAKKVYGSANTGRRLIIITDNRSYKSTMKRFNPGYSYMVVGSFAIDDGMIEGDIGERHIRTEVSEISHTLVTSAFDDVYIHAPSIKRKTLYDMLENFADMGVRTHLSINLPESIGQNAVIADFGDNICVNYSEKEFAPWQLVVKRLTDIVGSIVGLIITGFIYIIFGPLIKLDSPGPIIFSQIRIGRNAKRFKIYKFRSMRQDAEEHKQELMDKNQINGLMFKIDDDPRVTKIGSFMRRTSLDEFPQFWNVLKGDMSLVGTRPPTEDEFAHYNEHYRKRLTMKPGITGLWQVSGRSDITDFDEVVGYDLKYIDNWSIAEDFKILLKTIVVVFTRAGAK